MSTPKRTVNIHAPKIFLVILWWVACVGVAMAAGNEDRLQSNAPYFEVMHSGLSDDHLYCLMQDEDGYIWIGTRNGITRFDGIYSHRFGMVNIRKNRFGQAIRSLADDTHSRCVWASLKHKQTLLRIDKTTFETTELEYRLGPTSLQENRITFAGLFSLNDSTLLARTDKHFYLLNKHTGEVEKVQMPAGRMLVGAQFLRCADRILVIAGGNIYELNAVDGHFYGLTQLPLDVTDLVRRADIKDDNTLVIETIGDKCVNYYHLDLRTLKKDYITSIAGMTQDFCLADDGIWATTRAGLWFVGWDNLTPRQFSTVNSQLHDNRLGDILKVRNQPIFYVCSDDGLIKLNYYASKFNEVDMRRFSESKTAGVFRVLKDENGCTWVWCVDGLFRNTPEDIIFRPVNVKGLTDEKINFAHGMTFSPDGKRIYIASNRIVYYINIDLSQSGAIYTSGKVLTNLHFVSCDTLLVVSRNDITQMTASGGKAKTIYTQQDADITCSYLSDEGILWVADNKKDIFSFDPKTNTRTAHVSLPADAGSIKTMRSAVAEGLSELWIGTVSGLYYYLPGYHEARRIETSDYLSSGIEIVEIDNDGKVWVGTDAGIVCINNDKLIEYSNLEYNMQSRFNTNAVCRTSQDEIIMGGQSGIVSFLPYLFSRNTYFPPPIVTSYRFSNAISKNYDDFTAGERIFNGQQIKIPAGIRSVQLFIRSLSYDRPFENEVDWALTDDDSEPIEWHRHSTRSVLTLINLKAGNHKLIMKTVSPDGQYASEATEIDVYKEIFFYEQKIFIFIYWFKKFR